MTRSNAAHHTESSRTGGGRRPFHSRARRSLKRWPALAVAAGLIGMGIAPNASAQTETLVFVRHGEKPAKGFGQLDCQGLNRAMALPAVIAAKFGKPDAVYAPNPSMKKKDHGVWYDYVRPLATIEPTAIQFGLPVDTDYGYAQIEGLEQALVAPEHAGKLIVTAWEHREIEDLVRNIMSKHGGASPNVPRWESSDFDSMYVVKLDWSAQDPRPHATFVLDHEGLDGRTTDCPCAALPDAPAGESRGSQ